MVYCSLQALKDYEKESWKTILQNMKSRRTTLFAGENNMHINFGRSDPIPVNNTKKVGDEFSKRCGNLFVKTERKLYCLHGSNTMNYY